MRTYFPDHGYYNKPFYFESSEEIFPGLVLACTYDYQGLETWGLFAPDMQPVRLADLGPYEAKFAMDQMVKQSERHLAKYRQAIEAYTEEMNRLPKE